MFDNVMLMVEGRFIYQGKGRDAVKDYFSKIGFTCGRLQNPAGEKQLLEKPFVLIFCFLDYLISLMHAEDQRNVSNYAFYFESYDTILKPDIIKSIMNSEKIPLLQYQY